jgi:hypothetical protein
MIASQEITMTSRCYGDRGLLLLEEQASASDQTVIGDESGGL